MMDRMSSPVAHLACAYAIHTMAEVRGPRIAGLPSWAAWMTVGFFSLAPDLDFALAGLLRDVEGYHNQITHSLFFGLAMCGVATWVLRRMYPPLRAGAFFGWSGLCYAVHLAVDCLTHGRGLMLFWPLTSTRFSSPWPLLQGVRWDQGWISASHLVTLAQDAAFALVVVAINMGVQRVRGRAR